MAGLGFVAQSSVFTTDTVKKAVLQIVAAANHRVLVDEISISFTGTSASGTPILVEVERHTSAGSGGDALTLVKQSPGDDETLQTSALENIDDSGGLPTLGDYIMGEHVHPQFGFLWQAPQGKPIIVPGGTRLGISVTAAAAVNCNARIKGEE